MSRKQILIVEDEPIVSRDIQHTIVSFGYEVAATASSGEEAVQKSRRADARLDIDGYCA